MRTHSPCRTPISFNFFLTSAWLHRNRTASFSRLQSSRRYRLGSSISSTAVQFFDLCCFTLLPCFCQDDTVFRSRCKSPPPPTESISPPLPHPSKKKFQPSCKPLISSVLPNIRRAKKFHRIGSRTYSDLPGF